MTDFQGFAKIPRFSRDCIITEKIDGTNAQIFIGEDGEFEVGSRNRWITPNSDNYGFARWAYDRRDDLVEALGPGRHFGEWWGKGIQRKYGMQKKIFSLFNVRKWPEPPKHCQVVPVIYEGPFNCLAIFQALTKLSLCGSVAAPGFDDPEGVVIFHKASGQLFKKTLQNDEVPKGGIDA